MALAIDITDGRGLSNKARRELLFKKEQGNAVITFLFAVNITNKMERFSYKSGRDARVSKLIKEDWPIVLQWAFQLKTIYTTCKKLYHKSTRI